MGSILAGGSKPQYHQCIHPKANPFAPWVTSVSHSSKHGSEALAWGSGSWEYPVSVTQQQAEAPPWALRGQSLCLASSVALLAAGHPGQKSLAPPSPSVQPGPCLPQVLPWPLPPIGRQPRVTLPETPCLLTYRGTSQHPAPGCVESANPMPDPNNVEWGCPSCPQTTPSWGPLPLEGPVACPWHTSPPEDRVSPTQQDLYL